MRWDNVKHVDSRKGFFWVCAPGRRIEFPAPGRAGQGRAGQGRAHARTGAAAAGVAYLAPGRRAAAWPVPPPTARPSRPPGLPLPLEYVLTTSFMTGESAVSIRLRLAPLALKCTLRCLRLHPQSGVLCGCMRRAIGPAVAVAVLATALRGARCILGTPGRGDARVVRCIHPESALA